MKTVRGCAGRRRTAWLSLVLPLGLLVGARGASAQPTATIFSGAGTVGATTALNRFRAALGSVNNAGVPGPLINGRREINWDGVKLDGTDFGGNTDVIVPGKVVGIPVNRFQSRGVLFAEEYAVSGDGFVSVNPGVAGQFPAFSPPNTFAMFNETTIELSFVLPSFPNTTPQPAAVRGFGAIFLDVEHGQSSSIEFFNGDQSLGKFFVPPGPSGQPEFLGVLFDSAVVTSVSLVPGEAEIFDFNETTRTVTPGPPDLTLNPALGIDMVATDDFVYSEPVAQNRCVITSGRFAGFQIAPTDEGDTGEPLDVSPDFNLQTLALGTLTPGEGGLPGTFVGTFLGRSVTVECEPFDTELPVVQRLSDAVMTNLGASIALNQTQPQVDVAQQDFASAFDSLSRTQSQLVLDFAAGMFSRHTLNRLRGLVSAAQGLERMAFSAFRRAENAQDPRPELARAIALLNAALQAKQKAFAAVRAAESQPL